MNSFIPAKRNVIKLLDLNYVKWQIKTKISESYRNYEYGSDKGYVGKGFVLFHEEVTEEELAAIEILETMNPSEDYLEDFYEIIRISKRKGLN